MYTQSSECFSFKVYDPKAVVDRDPHLFLERKVHQVADTGPGARAPYLGDDYTGFVQGWCWPT